VEKFMTEYVYLAILSVIWALDFLPLSRSWNLTKDLVRP
jgi:hypothetical protein